MAEANRFLIAIDDGHGQETSGKRTPVIPELRRSIKENEFNRAVASLLDQELRRLGFRTLLVAPTDVDTPLANRTNLANSRKANIYVSIHYNAGGGRGIETYYYPGSSSGKKLAETVHRHITKGTSQVNRGIKTADFYVLRETSMPAILIEFGFMDDPGLIEARRMLDKAFQTECALETAQGICEYFGVPYRTSPPNPVPPNAPKPSVPKYPGYLIKKGSIGSSVRLIQRQLGGLVVDGIFGPKTEARVKAFQKQKKLAVDGIVGPITWRSLFGS
ncbi:N-acetylmuramoyl-L-alanine amidase [Risungbinella massiliensis]|uniref:N-acetylmuramoyl-L-alanine amidase n=1 Tax=Risungbinella massiliensis TaxID=1329796 RepID=UPI00069B9FFB|nr:N-acetylmuramoyl-L-alanine amidase [Risungbinella massiliensis]